LYRYREFARLEWIAANENPNRKSALQQRYSPHENHRTNILTAVDESG